MQISKIYPITINNNYKKQLRPNTIQTHEIAPAENYDVSKIAFGAIYNVKPKKLNIELEQNKLLKQITEILSKDIEELDFEDFFLSTLNRTLNQFRTRLAKLEEISKQLESLEQSAFSTPMQKLETLLSLQKEFKRIEKLKFSPPKTPTQPDEKTDFQLINKFKSAINKGDYRLNRVYTDHYSGLNEIKTVKELQEKYPKIKVPPTPQEVIANKIVKTLTRDFYENLDELILKGEPEEVIDYLHPIVKNFTDNIAKKYNFNPDDLYINLATIIHKAMLDSYENIRSSHGFAALPIKRKSQMPDITEIDAKMLSVNFDDFVLDVIRKQYLENKKLNEIIFTQNNTTINAQKLNVSEYKFDKASEKIKRLISMGESIEKAQRDYKSFTPEELKARLDFFASSNIGNNDELFEHIITFDSCKFEPEDVEQLIKFLAKLDDIRDGKITTEQALEIIKKENITPKGTIKLDEIEHQKAIEKFKAEQANLYQLNTLRDKFDNIIDILYMNNLNGIANTCAKYSPTSLASHEVKNAEFLINTISQHIKDNNLITNKKLLETYITRWDTFNYYKQQDPQNHIYQRALSIASKPDGNIDINKAGQYIMNSEIINNYPESRAFCRTPEILDKIMEKAPNKETAIKYLTKFDDYFTLPENEQAKINTLLDIFNQKDPIDKAILKHIIENHYSNTNTTIQTRVNDKGTETLEATISSSAKKQILEKYKYPGCIEYMREFEEALTSFAGARGASGIKKTGTNNNALEYKMELKLKGHDDRLFSSKNDYVFDIFSSKGLH